MSAEVKPQPTAGTGEDPSMEDILASIRRILTEEQPPEPPAAPASAPAAEPVANDDDVLVLDSSMMIADTQETGAQPAREPAPEEPVASVLVAPEAAAAAASSVGNLIRTLAADRSMQVTSSGPTIEDVVRAELRPLLREWLNVNLPPLVERLVRAEIERVVGRAVP
jgi:uncharacterized protein